MSTLYNIVTSGTLSNYSVRAVDPRITVLGVRARGECHEAMSYPLEVLFEITPDLAHELIDLDERNDIKTNKISSLREHENFNGVFVRKGMIVCSALYTDQGMFYKWPIPSMFDLIVTEKGKEDVKYVWVYSDRPAVICQIKASKWEFERNPHLTGCYRIQN